MRRYATPILALGALAIASFTPAIASPGETHGTAETLEDGQWELGLFAALRRGMGNGMELSLHPLTAIKAPNLALKKIISESEGKKVAVRHSLTYATPLLKTLSTPGTGGVLPADSTIPHIVALDNRFLASQSLNSDTLLTLSARILLGLSFGESDWPQIDMPIALPRTAAYQDTISTAVGVQLDGQLTETLGYRLDIDAWMMPLSEAKWAVEARAHLPWRPSEHFTAQLTGVAVAGAYNYGTNWHLLPGFDLIWGW
jgi:hypothetical protein